VILLQISSCNCRTLFDIVNKQHKIIQNEELILEEDFWADQQKARQVMQETDEMREEVENFLELQKIAQELSELCIMAETSSERKEIIKQVEELNKEVAKLEFFTLFDGKYDINDVIVTIHTGAGGVDAQDWTEMLMRMYLKWAEKKNYKITIIDKVAGNEAGIKNVTFELSGKWSYGHLRSETGVHRMVRLSPFNSDNLRQTSFARVEIMPIIEKVEEVELNLDDLRIDTYRASGAGGQHVNTTDSAVRITHKPSGIVAQCQNERSQSQNKEQAMKLLKAKLHKKFLDEQEKQKKKLRGEIVEAGWGNQIRSYILHPYKMVKDHRTKYETTDVESVLNGCIDEFIMAFLRM
jgi:peptide chain release factor 2